MYRLLAMSTLAILLAACSNKQEATVETGEKGTVAKAAQTATTFTVDTEASTVAWLGKKVTGQHNGTVPLASGSFSLEDQILQAGTFVIDFTKIKVLDIEEAEKNAKLTRHLKSPDFFSVEAHPTGQFAITRTELLADSADYTHSIYGNLTLKDITKEIRFPAKVQIDNGRFVAEASFNIDRKEWDIMFHSGLEKWGDKTIYDDIQIDLKLVAHAGQAPEEIGTR